MRDEREDFVVKRNRREERRKSKQKDKDIIRNKERGHKVVLLNTSGLVPSLCYA